MTIHLRTDFAYSLLVPTSMGVRLTPAQGQPVHCSKTFTLQATSAESNVASVSSYRGLPVKVLTAFVEGSPIARFIRDDLAGRHIVCEGKEVDPGGPWGYRHQINIADSGSGSCGAPGSITTGRAKWAGR
jgi:2-dehydro-3-deoxygluconokinase